MTHRIRIALAAVITGFALPGCMNMSGLSGSSNYACKAPDGVACDSVSGTYANAIHQNLPSQRARRPAAGSDAEASPPTRPASVPARLAPSSQQPPAQALRSPARVLRLWFKPWEDADRDLYDQGYVYVQIDSGQWLIDHMQRQIRDTYAPLRPPPKSAASAAQPDTRDGTPGLARPENPQRPTLIPDSLRPPFGTPANDSP